MKKTLTAIAAVAALGTGIITAQAETGFDPYESVAIFDQMNSTVPGHTSEIFLTNDGHSL